MSATHAIPLTRIGDTTGEPRAVARRGALSWQLLGNLARDVVRARTRRQPILEPLVVAWYCTYRCNLDCTYCFLAEKGWTHGGTPELDTAGSLALLEIVRKASPNLYLTGGEPFLRRDLVALLRGARELGFASISMVTNASLLHRRPEVLDLVDNLVVSMDSVDVVACAATLRCTPSQAGRILGNIGQAASLQRARGFRMAANFVASAANVDRAREVWAFCRAHDIRFTIGPQLGFDGRPDPVTRDDDGYRALIQEVLDARGHDPSVLDGRGYLETIRDFRPFRCLPSLTPRISPAGGLYYPCRPLQALEIDLRTAGSLHAAQQEGAKRLGPLPDCDGRCFMNCFVAPSLFVTRPVRTVLEHLGAECTATRARPPC